MNKKIRYMFVGKTIWGGTTTIAMGNQDEVKSWVIFEKNNNGNVYEFVNVEIKTYGNEIYEYHNYKLVG
jgi:hypothetical protein